MCHIRHCKSVNVSYMIQRSKKMAGSKGKVGGRDKQTVKLNTCEYCGKTDDTVIRVKASSPTGACKMIWECKNCLDSGK